MDIRRRWCTLLNPSNYTTKGESEKCCNPRMVGSDLVGFFEYSLWSDGSAFLSKRHLNSVVGHLHPLSVQCDLASRDLDISTGEA